MILVDYVFFSFAGRNFGSAYKVPFTETVVKFLLESSSDMSVSVMDCKVQKSSLLKKKGMNEM